MALETKIASLLHLPDAVEQVKALQSLVLEISASKDTSAAASDLKLVVNKIFSHDDGHSQITKVLISALAKSLKSLHPLVLQEVGSHLLQCLRDRPLVYDEADHAVRDALFDHYISAEEFSQAAQVLAGLNLDSTVRPYSVTEKVDVFIKCAGMLKTFHCNY